MASSDELDRRIRRVLEVAQSDAPAVDGEMAPTVSTASRPRPTRWLLVAASVALLIGAVAVLTRRAPEESAQPADSVATSAATTTSTEAVPLTTETLPPIDPSTCHTGPMAPYEEVGTVHTVVPTDLPVTVRLGVLPRQVCSGGHLSFPLVVTNSGSDAVDLSGSSFLITNGSEKWPLQPALADAQFGPGDTSIEVELDLPGVPPGDYRLYLAPLPTFVPIEVVGAPSCTSDDLTGSVVSNDGAMGTYMEIVRVTNSSSSPCNLSQPFVFRGVVSGGEPVVLSADRSDRFGAMSTPLADHLLAPGESADLWTATFGGCLDGTVVPVTYDALEVQLGVFDRPDAWVRFDQQIDTACGLWAGSTWVEPSTG